jgi:hypothetical protein
MWEPHIGGTPRDFAPCGDVLDRNCTLLFKHFERRYADFLPITPLVEECLLAISHSIIAAHGGRLWAKTNAPGAPYFSSPCQFGIEGRDDRKKDATVLIGNDAGGYALESLERPSRPFTG